ncbi:MAG TPA: hypothetical protein VJ783_17240 [Pirellulales bacterium]|nr:hypothetical protein [Pirellulales bacterium]
MSYRSSHPNRSGLQNAAKIAEAILRNRGEIELSAIESIPSVQSQHDVNVIIRSLQSKLPISIKRRVEQSSPILRWESVVTLGEDQNCALTRDR